MITIRYRMTGIGVRTHTFTTVRAAAECVMDVRRSTDMELIDVAAKPRLLGALALASVGCPHGRIDWAQYVIR